MQAMELLRRTPTRPARGPVPQEIASLPCGVGEVFSLCDEVTFGEFHEWIAQRDVSSRTVNGHHLTFLGGGEGCVFAIGHGPPARIIVCGERMPPLSIQLEFQSIYHLLLHSGGAHTYDNCGECRYSLAGLDAPRRCPECGAPIMELD
jgi:hypothetical protein